MEIIGVDLFTLPTKIADCSKSPSN